MKTSPSKQICAVCDSVPRKAYIGGESRLRCNCYTPDNPLHPVLIRMTSYTEDTKSKYEERERKTMADRNLAVVVQTEVLTPREVLNTAQGQAEALMELVEKRKLFQVIGGKKYLHAEAWITIGAFNQIVAQTDWIQPEKDEAGNITGYDAKVNLIHTPTGEIRGGAIMSCGLDSFPCRGKTGSEQHKAAKSAAQTWAVSKAFRMTHSYVPVLAGYEATPAEEMQASSDTPPPKKQPPPRRQQRSTQPTVYVPGVEEPSTPKPTPPQRRRTDQPLTPIVPHGRPSTERQANIPPQQSDETGLYPGPQVPKATQQALYEDPRDTPAEPPSEPVEQSSGGTGISDLTAFMQAVRRIPGCEKMNAFEVAMGLGFDNPADLNINVFDKAYAAAIEKWGGEG